MMLIHDDEDEEDEILNEARIEWRNVIFLQFHPLFKGLILVAVIVKSIVGPLTSIFPDFIYCYSDITSTTLELTRYLYIYCATPIIVLDLFLHVMHRQMSDIARQREYLPKSAFLLLLDLVGITPLFQLNLESECPVVQMWPNVLTLVELVLSYRVVEYLNLKTTHCMWNISLGFTTIYVITVNAMTCLWLLLTNYGLCKRCNDLQHSYDWRGFIKKENLNIYEISFELYSHAAMYLCSSLLSFVMCNIVARTSIEINTNNQLQIFAYAVMTHIVRPRLFCETVLQLKKHCLFRRHVVQVIIEAKRRTNDEDTIKSLRRFYQLLMIRRSGIINIPPLLNELPHYLSISIKEDMMWPVFYHSPIFRATSGSYKRYIADKVELGFKIPGEALLSGYYTNGNIVYLKSGIVQFMSLEDTKTPLISVTSGTIFGDANFLVPPQTVKMLVLCSTYCEIYYIKRAVLIKSLIKYPNDRKIIMTNIKEKFKHARDLYKTKKKAGVTDRTEDSGFSWLKTRWIQMSQVVYSCMKSSINVKGYEYPEFPPEQEPYHCSKYIGQLVMSSTLKANSKFIRQVTFPWIFVPSSQFLTVWDYVVKFTVLLVFILYPPCLIKSTEAIPWFSNFEFWVDIIFTMDMLIVMCVPLETASLSINFVGVVFSRSKTLTFYLNLLSTPIIPMLSKFVGYAQHYKLCQFNRLIKVYVFYAETYSHPPVDHDPFVEKTIKNLFQFFSYVYVSSFLVYLISNNYIHGIEREFFYCDFIIQKAIQVPIYWYSLLYMSNCATSFMESIYFKMVTSFLFYLINVYVKSKMFAIIYFKLKESITCQQYVSSMLSKYHWYQVHPHLINRLTKYTACYWRLDRGWNFLRAESMLKEEPYDVYYKVQGQFAEKAIMNSSVFRGADFSFIRDMAYNSTFLVLPKYSTLFSFGTQCDTLIWVVNGQIKCEYYDKSGALVSRLYPNGEMLSLSSVFFGKISIRTYIAHTDCEIIHLNIQTFKGILDNYPKEKKCFDICRSELGGVYDKMLKNHIRKHREFMKTKAKRGEFHKMKMREKILKSIDSFILLNREAGSWRNRVKDFLSRIWIDPSKKFMRYWLPFRALVAVFSVLASSLEGSIFISKRYLLARCIDICDLMAILDMILKCFIAYYNSEGVLVHAPRMRLFHYLSRSFTLDFIGVFPWVYIGNFFTTTRIGELSTLLSGTYARCAHLYIFLGYYDYVTDWPHSNGIILMWLKWQTLALCLKFVSAQHLLLLCYDAKWDKKLVLQNLTLNDDGTCFFNRQLDRYDEDGKFLQIYGRAFSITQFNSMGANFGKPSNSRLAQIDVILYLPFLVIDILYWYTNIITVVLLFLYFRKNMMLEDDINQLRNFLANERVEPLVIQRARAHFKYWWNRSSGMKVMNALMHKVGTVLRQDIMLYLCKGTLDNLGQTLGYSSHTKRVLASLCEPIYILPGEDIMREMNVVRFVYIVHRGRVTITCKGKKMDILTKGAIFGQLSGGRKERAIKVTARAEELADVLSIPHSQFENVFSDKIKATITELAVNDYIPMKNITIERPHDTIQYLTRGVPTIYFPGTEAPRSIKTCKFYAAWLQTVWLVGPMLGATSSAMLILDAPLNIIIFFSVVAVISDTILLVHIIIDFFFAVHLVIQGDYCFPKQDKLRKLKHWGLYVDILSLILIVHIPMTGLKDFHLARALRLKDFHSFHKHFCNSFRKRYKGSVLYLCCILLCLVYAVSARLKFLCQEPPIPQISFPIEMLDRLVDTDEYVPAINRTMGCNIDVEISEEMITYAYTYFNKEKSFLKIRPRTWFGDFTICMSYIFQFNFDYYELDPKNEHFNSWGHFCIELIMHNIINVLHLFMTGKALAFMYIRYRKMLRYDYRVSMFLSFLKLEGITKTLLRCIEKYYVQLWKRQKGNWLPELAMEAPECLKEDIMCALYYHHLELAPIFRPIPGYFLRQIATMFQRRVIFAGVDIVRQGDVMPNIFFIHEGEVEKCNVNKKGEKQVITVLTTNGYFGLFASMFPNTRYEFTYATRTVVDLVYLKYDHWKSLLNAYPDIDVLFKDIVGQLKKEMAFKQ